MCRSSSHSKKEIGSNSVCTRARMQWHSYTLKFGRRNSSTLILEIYLFPPFATPLPCAGHGTHNPNIPPAPMPSYVSTLDWRCVVLSATSPKSVPTEMLQWVRLHHRTPRVYKPCRAGEWVVRCRQVNPAELTTLDSHWIGRWGQNHGYSVI